MTNSFWLLYSKHVFLLLTSDTLRRTQSMPFSLISEPPWHFNENLSEPLISNPLQKAHLLPILSWCCGFLCTKVTFPDLMSCLAPVYPSSGFTYLKVWYLLFKLPAFGHEIFKFLSEWEFGDYREFSMVDSWLSGKLSRLKTYFYRF